MPASASPPSLRNLILTVYAKLVWSSTIWSRPCCKHDRIYWTSRCKQRIKLLFIIVGHDSKVILPDVEWLEQKCPLNSCTGSREDRKWKGAHSWVILELFLTHVRSDRFTIPNKGNNCHHYSRAHLRDCCTDLKEKRLGRATYCSRPHKNEASGAILLGPLWW